MQIAVNKVFQAYFLALYYHCQNCLSLWLFSRKLFELSNFVKSKMLTDVPPSPQCILIIYASYRSTYSKFIKIDLKVFPSHKRNMLPMKRNDVVSLPFARNTSTFYYRLLCQKSIWCAQDAYGVPCEMMPIRIKYVKNLIKKVTGAQKYDIISSRTTLTAEFII